MSRTLFWFAATGAPTIVEKNSFRRVPFSFPPGASILFPKRIEGGDRPVAAQLPCESGEKRIIHEGPSSMADKFDPYREALVIESETVWPEELADVPARDRLRIEAELHAHPEQCAGLEYVRMHTGFCRRITVTQDDLGRLLTA
jgi:hypothetical protein